MKNNILNENSSVSGPINLIWTSTDSVNLITESNGNSI